MRGINKILSVVCNTLDVPKSSVQSPRRDSMLNLARFLFAYIAFNHGYTQSLIAKLINRDHSNMSYAIQVTGWRIENMKMWKLSYNAVIQELDKINIYDSNES